MYKYFWIFSEICYLRQKVSFQSDRLKNYNRVFFKENIQVFVITCSILSRRTLTTPWWLQKQCLGKYKKIFLHLYRNPYRLKQLVCTGFWMLQYIEILILLQTQGTNTSLTPYFIFVCLSAYKNAFKWTTKTRLPICRTKSSLCCMSAHEMCMNYNSTTANTGLNSEWGR